MRDAFLEDHPNSSGSLAKTTLVVLEGCPALRVSVVCDTTIPVVLCAERCAGQVARHTGGMAVSIRILTIIPPAAAGEGTHRSEKCVIQRHWSMAPSSRCVQVAAKMSFGTRKQCRHCWKLGTGADRFREYDGKAAAHKGGVQKAAGG